jgi:hypothetical protein
VACDFMPKICFLPPKRLSNNPLCRQKFCLSRGVGLLPYARHQKTGSPVFRTALKTEEFFRFRAPSGGRGSPYAKRNARSRT